MSRWHAATRVVALLAGGTAAAMAGWVGLLTSGALALMGADPRRQRTLRLKSLPATTACGSWRWLPRQG